MWTADFSHGNFVVKSVLFSKHFWNKIVLNQKLWYCRISVYFTKFYLISYSESCYLPNYRINGKQIPNSKKILVDSAEQCQRECQKNTKCSAFTYNTPKSETPVNHRRCFLQKVTVEEAEPKVGVFTGPKTCPRKLRLWRQLTENSLLSLLLEHSCIQKDILVFFKFSSWLFQIL